MLLWGRWYNIYHEGASIKKRQFSILKSGYQVNNNLGISLDFAASSFSKKEKGKYWYQIGDKWYSTDELIGFYKKLIAEYPIISLEDPLDENDWKGWKKLNKEIGDKVILIGDDIFATNPKLIRRGVREQISNAVLIKPNQIGTISKTMEAIRIAQQNNWKWIISHRSGETLDNSIADLSYATKSWGLKAGAPFQNPEIKEGDDVRRAKYLRMINLERRQKFLSKKTPIGLIILDGWGVKKQVKGNAVRLAHTPNFDALWKNYPHTLLSASGENVGLPKGEMGNSEVGHLNIGAGRIVEQDVLRIDAEIKNGKFFKNPALKKAFQIAKKYHTKIHILGLVSENYVHSSLNHLFALLDFAKKENYSNVYVHAITDGRDCSPQKGLDLIESIEKKMEAIKLGKLATICGRYYAMDRDKNWSRVKTAYDLYTQAKGVGVKSWKEAIKESYKNNITDEFIKPIVILNDKNQPQAKIEANDVVIFFNFRQDRARELTEAFMNPDFHGFSREPIRNLRWICFTQYDERFLQYKNLYIAYPPIQIKNTLGEILSRYHYKQLRLAETEKYAHVTYFLNGGEETPFENEDRILIPSPKVKTYDMKPEMSSDRVTETLLNKMADYDFFALNFANPDMVGHTGNLEATIRAIETIDNHLGRIIQKGQELGYTFIITADHGNAEEVDKDDPAHLTAHSTNPVPFILVDLYHKLGNITLKEGGRLADIAPTILKILGLKQPQEMTGKVLFKKAKNTKDIFIKGIESQQILDSRGQPTIRARIISSSNIIGEWASVPSGKSKGQYEAKPVKVSDALKNIKIISHLLQGKNIFHQKEIDKILEHNINKWGANTTLAVSLALSKIAAQSQGLELAEYWERVYPRETKLIKQRSKNTHTRFLFNIFNGGLHALQPKEKLGFDKPSCQEFMINVLGQSYEESLKIGEIIYYQLGEILLREGYDSKSFGDEGGYAPSPKKGLNIPNGFSITSQAYFEYLESTGLKEKIKNILEGLDIKNLKELQERGKQVRSLIWKTPLPKFLEKEIVAYYESLCEEYKTKNLSVAVRSSATAEDLPEASFAGIHESFLNIRGKNNLLRAVKQCFISLFNDRAIVYRVEKNFDHFKVGLSVGVQKMIRSDKGVSGVIFSCDTETNFGDVILINASYGLGETIVKGRVNADQYYVYEKTLAQGYKPILEKRLGTKDIKLIYSKGSKSTQYVKVPKNLRDKFALTDEEILTLGHYSMIVESHYQKEMDIEFAKDGLDKQIYIVQARPETVQSLKQYDILESYELHNKKKQKPVLTGLSVGNKIATGKVKIIKDAKHLSDFQKGEILVTYATDPNWVPAMKLANAIITESGSRTCHAAIVGRELGVPTIVGVKDATKILKMGDKITVSCAEGEEGKIYRGFIPFSIKKTDVSKLPKPKVKIMMNLGEPNQAFNLRLLPNDGVGLAREEFIIANDIKIHPLALIHYRNLPPGIKKQIDQWTSGYRDKKQYFVDNLARGIAKIGAAFYPKEVIVRFSDFKTNEYRNLVGGDLYEPQEENPMLGWRGASRYYDQKFITAFKLECAALKKVRDEFGLFNVVPMIPFCRTPEEGKKVIRVMEVCGLKHQAAPRISVNQYFDPRLSASLKVYVMCEIPSNIILADEFLDIFDGMSIGSNDLTQLVLGIDRDSPELHSIADERNEAVKRLIKEIIQKCKAKNKYIGICGQAPSDYPEFAKFLIDEGIESISLNPDSILKTIKELE